MLNKASNHMYSDLVTNTITANNNNALTNCLSTSVAFFRSDLPKLLTSGHAKGGGAIQNVNNAANLANAAAAIVLPGQGKGKKGGVGKGGYGPAVGGAVGKGVGKMGAAGGGPYVKGANQG